MLAFPKALGRAVRLGATDVETRWLGRSNTRRVLFCVVLFGSLAPEAHSLSSGQSLQIRSSPNRPRGGWPAFLTAPRLPHTSWGSAAPPPVCRRSTQAANSAPPLLPVALLSFGITSDPRKVPWALHAGKHDTNWDNSFEELVVVKKGNGGEAHVTQRDPARPALGTWCVHQVRRSSPV